MTADKIFYADAQHQVFVTDSTFIVKKKEYNILGIRNHFIKEVKPVLLPGLVLMGAGTFLFFAGLANSVAFWFIPNVQIGNVAIDAFAWTIIFGVLLTIAGLFMMVMMKPRYALRIATAEGEDDVIISPKREHVRQIIDALNRAFMLKK